MKSKASPEPERRHRPTVNSALLQGTGEGGGPCPGGAGQLAPGTAAGGTASLGGGGQAGMEAGGADGTTSPGLALPSAVGAAAGGSCLVGGPPRRAVGRRGRSEGHPLVRKGPAFGSRPSGVCPGKGLKPGERAGGGRKLGLTRKRR